MRGLIVGLGGMGRRHLANLNSLGAASHVTILRRPASSDEKLDAKFDRVVFQMDDALKAKPDVALITGPASQHVREALILAEAGVHLFIEKPLSNSLDGVDELLRACRERSLVLMVGYNFRFYRPLAILKRAIMERRIGRPLFLRAEVGQFLPEWRAGTDYRQTVSARSELGGGAVLELSHELDYARWLLGEVKMVNARIAHLSDLEMDVEDTAEIILQFENGALGSIHLDMVQQPATRTCRIVGTEGTLIWDWTSHCVSLFDPASNTWSDLYPAGIIDHNEMYVEELRHFFDCVRRKGKPIVNGDDGKRVLEIALAVKQSSQKQRAIEL